MLDDLFVWEGIGRNFDIYYSMPNFDGHQQKLDRSCSFQSEDVAECCTRALQKLMAEKKKHLSSCLLSTPPPDPFSKDRTHWTMSSNCSNCITSWSLPGDGSHHSDRKAFLKISYINFGSSIIFCWVYSYYIV